MFCHHCDLHFADSKTGGRCPNCGREREALTNPAGVRPDLPGDPARTNLARGAIDLSLDGASDTVTPVAAATRTENVPPGVWRKGSVVAGKYEIICKIGSGGFGSVYKVRHIHRKKLYALKTPHPEFLRDLTFQKRFEREIEAMERFAHPDMVTVRDSGIAESGVPYYTMDFIDGESLRAVMSREGPLELRRAVKIIRRILEVLDVAHGHRIIHRDIKPDNVMLTNEAGREVIKVLDFGVAKLLDLVGNTATITHGMRVGTPKYMSPEQVRGDDVDGRSDLFAVGILFYEALTGRHPFAVDGDPIRTTAAILSKDPYSPQELRPEVPRLLSEKVLLLLEKKPRRRPQSARVALESIPDVDGGQSRSVARLDQLRFVEGALREPVTSVVLSRETPVGVSRVFLFFKDVVTLGRSNDPARGIDNDLILRRLPCQSPDENPDNWNLNLTISHRVASIRVNRTSAVIEPAADSKSGIMVGGLRTRDPIRIQSDHFHLSVGDRALELDGWRTLKNKSRSPLDLSCIPVRGGSGAAHVESPDAGCRIGYSNPNCEINCIRLLRSNNYPLHSYFIVPRRVAVGSGAGAELRIRDAGGVEGHHLSFIFDRAELFVLAVGGEVRLNDAVLRTGDVCPVVPGASVGFGSETFRVDAVTDDMFKRV